MGEARTEQRMSGGSARSCGKQLAALEGVRCELWTPRVLMDTGFMRVPDLDFVQKGNPFCTGFLPKTLLPKASQEQGCCGRQVEVSVTMIPMDAKQTLEAFDRFLAEKRLRLEAVVIGGAALNLMGVIARPTKDCDILDPKLSEGILAAARAFAAERRAAGEKLEDNWLNNGPASLAAQLTAGWRERLEIIFRGTAIELQSLARLDLLSSKLFALCDRGLDLGDCVAMAPTAGELIQLEPWLAEQDANPDWPAHVRETLQDLGRRLGHGV